MGAGDNDARIEVLSPAALPSRDPLCVPHEAKRSIRIFVVENDRALRDGLASMLGADGYEVTTAGSSSEALEALKRRSFDIVITDLYLTPVSGMEVLRAAQVAKRDTVRSIRYASAISTKHCLET